MVPHTDLFRLRADFNSFLSTIFVNTFASNSLNYIISNSNTAASNYEFIDQSKSIEDL